jgi:hypothetical protein
MNDHDAVWHACRRQLVEATYNAPHSQPPVNLCGALYGHRIEVFGETLEVTDDFKRANTLYHTARFGAAKALELLNETLGRKA